MPKKFYTEKDIEDMFKSGVMSLDLSGAVVLTELAYEKANSLGMMLVRDQPDNPPSAPVRPYISRKYESTHGSALPSPPSLDHRPEDVAVRQGPTEGSDLHQRIRNAVVARLGAEVDANLLDVIIRRVLNSTGVK